MPTARQRVLVVEDDASLRAAIVRLLTAAGMEPAVYPSAEELLAQDAADSAACIVSDWKLPELDGLGMLDALRARGSNVPLILITGHDARGLREEAARHGVAAYLPKPFRGAALLESIARVTRRGGAPPPESAAGGADAGS